MIYIIRWIIILQILTTLELFNAGGLLLIKPTKSPECRAMDIR